MLTGDTKDTSTYSQTFFVLLYKIIPACIDIATIFAITKMAPLLDTTFSDGSLHVSYAIMGLYLLLPLATWILKKVHATHRRPTVWTARFQAIATTCSLGFGIIILVALMQTGNLFSPTSTSAGMWMFVIGFFALLLHMGALVATPKTVAKTSRFLVPYTLALVIINSLVIISSSYWIYAFGGMVSTPGYSGERLLLTIFLFPLFCIFFAAPRVVHITDTDDVRSHSLLFIGFLYIIWQSLI